MICDKRVYVDKIYKSIVFHCFMIICVSGASRTGKTKLAKLLSKKYGFKYVDAGSLIKKEKLYSGYDKKLDSYEVDISKFVKFMKNFLKGKDDLVIDSHLSHYLDCDICYIAKCSIKELRKRLKKKKYSKNKIEENIEAEIMNVCLNEAVERGLRVKVVDTTKGLKINML